MDGGGGVADWQTKRRRNAVYHAAEEKKLAKNGKTGKSASAFLSLSPYLIQGGLYFEERRTENN